MGALVRPGKERGGSAVRAPASPCTEGARARAAPRPNQAKMGAVVRPWTGGGEEIGASPHLCDSNSM
eukprot:scaffold20356_cov125-Isochrysis_galbana.AAC.2